MQDLMIADGKVVSLAYVLTVNGEEIARTELEAPLEYLHGAEEILPGLEAQLAGKRPGDKLNVTLAAQDAYGEYDPEDVEELERSEFDDIEEITIGMTVEVTDEDGYDYVATVKELKGDSVLLDFNPPLAGKTLTYDVEVLGVREATDEEREHGHAHSSWMMDDDDFDDDDFDDEDFDDEEYEDDETDTTNGAAPTA